MTISEKRSTLQLTRLERLMDVVFALVIWRLFTFLPDLKTDGSNWESVADLLIQEWDSFFFVLLAVIIVIVYWSQNNSLLGNLKRTNGVHTAISVFQLIFVLFFLYAINAGIHLGSGSDSRLFESVTAMLVGVAAWIAWYYAMQKAHLLDPELSKEEAELIAQRNLAEPITAALTIPFAFAGPYVWELSWFLYPFIKRYFSRANKTQVVGK